MLLKSIIIKFCLVFCGAVLALTSWEIYFRFTSPIGRADLIPAYSFNCFTRGDYYFFKLKPNSECILKSNSGAFSDTVVKTNSLGLRNPEVSEEKPKDTTRILFVGDSYAMGWGVSEEKSFPRIVEKLLGEKFPSKQIEVINGSMVNTDPGYDYLFTKNQGLKFKPDIIVSTFFPFNDILDSTFDRVWVYVDKDGLPLKIDSWRTYVSPEGTLRFRAEPFNHKIPFLKDSYLYTFVMNRFLSPIKGSDVPPLAPRFCLYQASCKDVDPGKGESKILFAGIQKLAKDSGAKFLVARIPEEFLVDDTKSLKYGITVPFSPKGGNYYREYEDFFIQRGIDSLDLLPEFIKNKDKGLYYPDDDHFSESGHLLAAQIIAEKLAGYFEDK